MASESQISAITCTLQKTEYDIEQMLHKYNTPQQHGPRDLESHVFYEPLHANHGLQVRPRQPLMFSPLLASGVGFGSFPPHGSFTLATSTCTTSTSTVSQRPITSSQFTTRPIIPSLDSAFHKHLSQRQPHTDNTFSRLLSSQNTHPHSLLETANPPTTQYTQTNSLLEPANPLTTHIQHNMQPSIPPSYSTTHYSTLPNSVVPKLSGSLVPPAGQAMPEFQDQLSFAQVPVVPPRLVQNDFVHSVPPTQNTVRNHFQKWISKFDVSKCPLQQFLKHFEAHAALCDYDDTDKVLQLLQSFGSDTSRIIDKLIHMTS